MKYLTDGTTYVTLETIEPEKLDCVEISFTIIVDKKKVEEQKHNQLDKFVADLTKAIVDNTKNIVKNNVDTNIISVIPTVRRV